MTEVRLPTLSASPKTRYISYMENTPLSPKTKAVLTGLHNCGYYKKSFLQEVVKELQDKAFVVKSGLDVFSKAEQLAYLVLNSQGFFDD